jgi:hypothetical protein
MRRYVAGPNPQRIIEDRIDPFGRALCTGLASSSWKARVYDRNGPELASLSEAGYNPAAASKLAEYSLAQEKSMV